MEQSFAEGLNGYKLFWVFFIGCFLGVVVETIWCILCHHRIESRKGLVWGPFNLVYGFGALLMTVSLFKLDTQRDLIIFAFGGLIGGVYEYICSYIQEKMLGTISWDYKNFPFNLHGRINLLYCFFWGIMALIWVRDFYPYISSLIERIPNAWGISFTWICFAFIVLDTIMSIMVVYRMNKRTEKIPAKNALWRYIDRHYDNNRVKKIYPNMEFLNKNGVNVK